MDEKKAREIIEISFRDIVTNEVETTTATLVESSDDIAALFDAWEEEHREHVVCNSGVIHWHDDPIGAFLDGDGKVRDSDGNVIL